jgi:antitoxin (DNA-binding transcriptional repressor) of toxin-antitoxin stability system
MATFRISESEATRDFAAVLARVRAGEEIVIERDTSPIAVVLPAPGEGPGRLLSESIAAAEARGSTAVMDEDFARDVEAAIAAHREPLNPPEWD